MRDISHANPLPPAGAQAMIVELNELGFHRLGETLTVIPDSDSGLTWWLANQEGSISVEVVDIYDTPTCQFTTIFLNNAVLETTCPTGRNITKKNYYAQTTDDSIKTAYAQHLRVEKSLRTRHGIPRRMPTLIDYINWDPIYRELYVQHKLSSQVRESIIKVMDFAVGFLVFAGVYLVVR